MVKLIVLAPPSEVVVPKAVDLPPMSQTHAHNATCAGEIWCFPVVAVYLGTELCGYLAIGVIHTLLWQVVNVLDHSAVKVKAHIWLDILGFAKQGPGIDMLN